MMRAMIGVSVVTVIFGLPMLRRDDRPAATADALNITEMTAWDHRNLERNLRWMLQRERTRQIVKEKLSIRANKPVAVFADAGVWHVGATSIVQLLESKGINCRVIDRSLMNDRSLAEFGTLILPGGWAPYQWQALGVNGLQSIKTFVDNGGRCIGICAGAYLVSKTTRYEGKDFPYPLGLFDGVAEGPVEGLAKFPNYSPVEVTATSIGKTWGLDAVAGEKFLYGGGPFFVGGTGMKPLLHYANGTVAAAVRSVGKGTLVIIGVHLERPSDGKDESASPPCSAELFKSLVRFEPTSKSDR